MDDYNQEPSVISFGGGNGNSDNKVEKSLSREKSIEQITVKVGQQAMLPCFVTNLGSHKVIRI